MPDNSTLLAFDYGLARIGVAIGQTVTQTARPLAMVQAKQGKPDWPAISKLIDTWKPNTLLVGLPLAEAGGSQAMTDHAQRFARQLDGRYRIEVAMIDERYSSHEARYRLGEKAGPLDALAATVILEDWFTTTEQETQ